MLIWASSYRRQEPASSAAAASPPPLPLLLPFSTFLSSSTSPSSTSTASTLPLLPSLGFLFRTTSEQLNCHPKNTGRAHESAFGPPCSARLARRRIYPAIIRCTVPSNMQVCIAMHRHIADLPRSCSRTFCFPACTSRHVHTPARQKPCACEHPCTIWSLMLCLPLGLGPGQYEVKSGIGTRPTTRIPEGHKTNIIEEIAKRRAFTPGPGHYKVVRDPTPDVLAGKQRLAFIKTCADRHRKRAVTGVFAYFCVHLCVPGLYLAACIHAVLFVLGSHFI